jgi:hypothetical protein
MNDALNNDTVDNVQRRNKNGQKVKADVLSSKKFVMLSCTER